MDLLEVQNRDAVRVDFERLSSHYKFLPPIIMMLTTSKLFFLLLCNIVWVVVIVKAGRAAATYHKYFDQTRRNYENTMANVNPAFDNLRDEQKPQDYSSIQDVPISSTTTQAQDAAELRYNDTTRLQTSAYPYQIGNNNVNNKIQQQPSIMEEPPKYRNQRPSSLIVAAPYPERPLSQQRNDMDRDVENRFSRYQESNGNIVKTVEPLKYDDIPEQQQSNVRVRVLPSTVVQFNRTQSDSKPKPIPPPKPQNRYSMQPQANESPVLYRPERNNINNPKVDRSSSSMRAPDELRSQLPWSYFKPRDETPRRAFTQLSEGEETPNVPVPDYTLHYGRKTRGNLSDSDHQRY